VIINPEITPMSDAKEEGWEGCLSIPDIRGMVPRYVDITVRAARSPRQIDRDAAQEFPGTRRSARDGSSRRRAVLRSDALDGIADVLEEFSKYWSKGDGED
jgi:hypothetical protein